MFKVVFRAVCKIKRLNPGQNPRRNLSRLILQTALSLVMGLWATTALASYIQISAEFKVYSDVNFPGSNSQWDKEWVAKLDEEKKIVYLLEKTIYSGELPYTSRLGDAFLSINKQGVLSLGLKHSNKIGETITSFRIPQLGGVLLPNDIPYMIQATGADHLTHAWSFAGRVTLKID